jgi:hypothetical protein
MGHYLTSDDKYRDLIYAGDDRSHRVGGNASPGDYRFGRPQGKHVRVHARSTLRRINGYLKTMIEAIANAKLRRMERELELRGIRLHRSNDSRAARKSRPTES